MNQVSALLNDGWILLGGRPQLIDTHHLSIFSDLPT